MQQITADHYRQILSYGADLNENHLFKILFNKPKEQMTLKEIQAIDFNTFNIPTGATWCDLVYFNGTLYGKTDVNELTFGEYLDLVDLAKDVNKNLIKMMTVLWRPVSNIGYYNRAKAFIANKLLVNKSKRLRPLGFKLLAGVKYKVEAYDTKLSFDREKQFKQMPAEVAAYTAHFFFLTSTLLLKDTLKFTKQTLQQMQSRLQTVEFQKKI
jgi:hypothetical protein